jgi:hypothetical protein
MAADNDDIEAISSLGPFAAPPRSKYERLIANAGSSSVSAFTAGVGENSPSMRARIAERRA